uniref:Putative aldo/keto reductase family n=1 Tax=Corethrella appendiculata TaxID=1370023 RepID=U5EWM2_9DIPT
MASKVPNVVLNNGKNMPIIGLGTWGSPTGEVAQAVKDALDIGYRHIDCAFVYGNEPEVGEGINAKINEGIVKRDEVFVTSKLWNTFHRPDLVEGALKTTLKNLNLSYIDLYLIHWPMAYKEDGELFPKDDKDQVLYSDVDYLDTWREMEKLVDAGLTKTVGLSNFNARQVDRVYEAARIKPAVIQIECHPYLNQKKLSAHCAAKNITVTAYSPLGSPNRPWAKPEDPNLLNDPKIVAIADKYNKTTAQILIKYQVQRGHVVIPKSVNKNRMKSNFEVFDFILTDEDIALIDSFGRPDGRLVPLTGAYGHPHHPFEKDEY